MPKRPSSVPNATVDQYKHTEKMPLASYDQQYNDSQPVSPFQKTLRDAWTLPMIFHVPCMSSDVDWSQIVAFVSAFGRCCWKYEKNEKERNKICNTGDA